MKSEIVAEIEGEYGPLTISERLVQKLWARGEFRQSDLLTLEGRSLELLNLGTWNLLDGPDFKNVAIKVDGQLIHGDAELHFFDSDWESHGHESDPAFENVVLHILVFPPRQRNRLLACSVGHSLLFIDLLPQGLESYAEEEVLGALTAGEESALEEELLALPFEQRMAKLVSASRKRWEGKVSYARKRLDLLGWEEACHQTALEILGYRYNRSAMLFLAGDYSLKALQSGAHSAGSMYEAGKGRWKMAGTRPANHPKHRLSQYLEWVGARPHWPEDLERWVKRTSILSDGGVSMLSRKALGLAKMKKRLSDQVLADTIGGTRIENLVCDGFLPLLCAQTDEDYFPVWYYWFPGDVPSALQQLLRRVGEGTSKAGPRCNGAFQGLIGCLLEK